MMQRYELLYILAHRFTDKESDEISKKIRSSVEKFGGSKIEGRVWGKRKLAYPIQGDSYGTYMIEHFDMEPKNINELSKAIGLFDEVLRSLVVSLEPQWHTNSQRYQALLKEYREKKAQPREDDKKKRPISRGEQKLEFPIKKRHPSQDQNVKSMPTEGTPLTKKESSPLKKKKDAAESTEASLEALDKKLGEILEGTDDLTSKI